MTVKKPAPRSEFKPGEHIVYPAHGVGRIMGIDTQEVAGIKLELFVVSFVKDKMTLRVPVMKASTVGMRKLADQRPSGERSRRCAAVPASSAPCGAGGRRNTRPRSIPAT